MKAKYEKTLSPIQVGGVVLKSRLISSNALPHFLQGPEHWPADPIISYFASVAKNGAAIVSVSNRDRRRGTKGDMAHMALYDLTDPSCENYVAQIAENIHFYNSKASIALLLRAPEGYGVADNQGGKSFMAGIQMPVDMGAPVGLAPGGPAPGGMPPMMPGIGPTKAMTVDMIKTFQDETLEKIKYYHGCGFDGVSLHMSYDTTILCKFFSPKYNTRTDAYGGSFENRCRLILELVQRIKAECGKDFLVELQISGEEPGGHNMDDVIALGRLAEPWVDIFQLRAADVNLAHPVGYNSVPHEPVTLKYATAFKKAGLNILAAPCGGFQDPADIERWISEGKMDMAAAARAFICDPEYGKKLYAGRGEDVVPCIRCDRCHGTSRVGPWVSVCSVNPKLGLDTRLCRLITPPERAKRVAVVGGGPAGMVAALTAADRGHEVTLYEKNGYLGGQLRHADFASFKWPIRDYKDYLARQLEKRGVRLLLNTAATPSLLSQAGYDAVLLALGAQPGTPDTIAGVVDTPYWSPLDVYGREAELGRRVVVVGGSETGTETGLYLAETGHEVTVLTRQKELAQDATPIHYIEMFRERWQAAETFSFITEAATVEISKGAVVYLDKSGEKHTLPCDDIVLSCGMKPLHGQALAFSGCAPEVFILGDCGQVGNIQKATRSGYSIASMI